MESALAVPLCYVCSQPVALEDCKIDEQGPAVHEKCYVDQVAQKKSPRPANETS